MRNTIHTRLLVLDFPACLHFYNEILGFKVTWDDGDYASFSDGELRLAIFKRQMMAEALDRSGKPLKADTQDTAVLVFEVGDVDSEYHELRDRGVVFEKAPQNFPGWGIRAAYFRDPDGNLIEINSGLKDVD